MSGSSWARRRATEVVLLGRMQRGGQGMLGSDPGDVLAPGDQRPGCDQAPASVAASGWAPPMPPRPAVRSQRPDKSLARRFRLKSGATLFRSVVVHYENDLPIQVDDRHVNPHVAPQYLAQDCGTQTPNAYLMRVAPLQGVEFSIEAVAPSPEVRELLRMTPHEPCLVLHRQTASMGQVASVAVMWHAASRYRFTGRF